MRFPGSKIEPKSLQNRSRKASKPKSAPGALLRGHKIESRSLLGASGPPKKLLESARGGPRGNLEIGFSTLKTYTHPAGGPLRILRTLVLEHFSLKSVLSPARGAKIEGPGIQGATLGVGGRS